MQVCLCVLYFGMCVCVILFNYRSGFETEANSAIITGNTSFNILWKSTPCVSLCVSRTLSLFIQPERGTQEEKLGGSALNDFRLLQYLAISRLLFHPSVRLHRLSFHICVSKWLLLNAPFFPTFELLLSQIFMQPFYRVERQRGEEREGGWRDVDLSIKDEQHLKCIKRGR